MTTHSESERLATSTVEDACQDVEQASDSNAAKSTASAETQSDATHEAPQASEDGMAGSICGVQIMATGSYAPEIIVSNDELASTLGFDSDWIVQRTGILERRRAPDDMCTSEVAFRAAQACLKKAGVSAKSLDMIVVGTMTPDHPTPATACNLQLKLGATCPAFDLNAACSGFMYALAVGMQFVAAESSRKVLVIGVDLMSRTVNPKDHKTFALFGDGAGAVLLGEGTPEQGLLSYFLGAQADGGQFLCQPAGGTCEPLTPERLEQGRQFVEMDGRAVFKWAVRIIEMASRRVLQDAGLTTDDIDSVVLHQANVRIIDAAVNSLKISRDRVFVNVDRYGNTSAGSIPLALDEAVQAGKIRPGDKVLLVGFGAGLTWGACVAQW